MHDVMIISRGEGKRYLLELESVLVLTGMDKQDAKFASNWVSDIGICGAIACDTAVQSSYVHFSFLRRQFEHVGACLLHCDADNQQFRLRQTWLKYLYTPLLTS